MICIVEPSTVHPISGGYLYNKNLERVGAVSRFSTEKPLDAYARADRWLLFDSLFLQSGAAWDAQQRGRSAWLLHALPETEGPWIKDLAAFPVAVVTSEAMAQRVRALSPKSRLIVCEPGLEPLFHAASNVPPAAGALRILSVANVLPGKGFREACGFLEALSGNFPAWEWIIAGSEKVDPHYSAQFRKDLEARGWLPRVHFHGLMDPREGLYQKADLFLSFSRAESFGMAIQEAAALGIPIVATAVGIVQDLLEGDPWAVILERGREQAALPEARALCTRIAQATRPLRTRRIHRLLQRSWQDAGRELQAQIAQC